LISCYNDTILYWSKPKRRINSDVVSAFALHALLHILTTRSDAWQPRQSFSPIIACANYYLRHCFEHLRLIKHGTSLLFLKHLHNSCAIFRQEGVLVARRGFLLKSAILKKWLNLWLCKKKS
jgi:hypothetical protein